MSNNSQHITTDEQTEPENIKKEDDHEKNHNDNIINDDMENINIDNNSEENIDDDIIPIGKLPSYKKILIAYDGKKTSNNAINYGISIAKLTGAELCLLRILDDMDKLETVSVEGSSDANLNENDDFTRKIKGEVIDSMEQIVKECKDVEKNINIVYKFLTGSVVDEIADEINNNNYDLLILTSNHIDSWIRSLFSDARKIISNVSIPVLLIQ